MEFLGDSDDSGSRPGPQPSRELNKSNSDGESEEPVQRRRRLNKAGDSDQQGPVAVIQSEKWDSDRVRRALQKVTKRYTDVKISTSAWRQIAIAIQRKYIRPGQPVIGFDREEEEEGGGGGLEGNIQNAAELQAGHQIYQAVISYARLAMEGPSIIHTIKEAYRKVSED